MAKETKSSQTETQKITEEELEKVTTLVLEEELEKLTIIEVEELKNATTVEGEKLKNVTIAEGEKLKNVTNSQIENMEKVKLITSDGITFEVELSIVKEMETVHSFLDFNDANKSVAIPLPNVTSRYLGLIIDYLMEHYRVAGAGNLEELKEFDNRFVEELDTNELKELLFAANYLDMKNFFEFICSSIAKKIKNKSVDFARNFFGLHNDYTPEEEAEYRRVNIWAFQNIDED